MIAYSLLLQTNLTDDEILHNKELFEDILANEFPEEDMADKSFRDKVPSFNNIIQHSFELLFLGQRLGPQVMDTKGRN